MKTNFTEERFPEDISFGALGGPEYKTEVITSINGIEYRNSRWSNSRAKYNVAYGIRTKEQMQKLLSFFRAHKGKAIGFRFKDWCDYNAEKELIGTGNGFHKKFQLTKKYYSGASHEIRIINKPIKDTVKIYINNKIISSADYELDHNKGIIEFLHAPTIDAQISASFEFDVYVRFDNDYLPISIEDHELYSCRNINLIEIKATL